MLSDLQTRKLTHYFELLDYDGNGIIEKSDFTAIAENLCVLWGFREGTEKYNYYIKVFSQSWDDFRHLVENNDREHATLTEWLEFGDRFIVNGTDEQFEKYVQITAREIFDCFDSNKDGYISLEEYIDLFMAYRIEVRYSAKAYIKLDLNSDDLLSKEELLEGVDQFFRSNDEQAPGNWLYGFWSDKQDV